MKLKRFFSAFLAAALLAGTVPAALAADIDSHWSKPYVTSLHELGIINPSASTGNYTPEASVTRWEFMRYINRAFDFTEKASISFSDVKSSDTYYETIQIAVKHGYINGMGNNRMDPEGTLTREQAATILGRLHKYAPTASASKLDVFTDKSKISSYATSYVAEAVSQGYINGYTDGTFKPQGNLRRGEIAKILYFYLGSSLGESGRQYTAAAFNDDTKNVTISAACTLSDATIEGNLYITEGVLSGNVNLNNVTVKGDIIVGGGNVTLDGVTAMNLIVSNPMGIKPTVIATGSTNIGTAEVQSSASLSESGLSANAGGFSDVTVTGEGASLSLDASVWDLDTKAASTIVTTGSTLISELTADAKTTVTGNGSVQTAKLNASGCELVMQPAEVQLASGVTATIAGKSAASSTSVSVSPSTLSIDINNKDNIAFSYEFLFNADKNDLTRVTVGGKNLRQGTDYNILSDKNGIRIYKTYLSTLSVGTYTAELSFEDGTKAAIGIVVSNSSLSAVSPSQVTFDKYEGSANHADVTVTLSLPAGTLLDTVKLGSSVLERGKDYNYNATSGTVTFLRETLAKKSKGSYTITFVPTRGSSSSCSLTVTDSAPVNEVAPSSVDFDANTSSGGYQDVSVTLSKTAVAQFGKDGATYADFTFVMSKGQSPTLRVNYVTTYALTANVVDDLGLPISGATVTFTPNDAESGTAAQTLVTDSDGKATVYVKRGSYTLTATHERFTSAITQTTSVSSGRTVKMTGEILETVQLVVTNEYGAPLSGAAVSIGGKTITTGADGTASFSVKRGSYVAQVACTGYKTQAVQLSVTGSLRERVKLG